jgi:lipoprotein-releasing system permease protein
MAGPHASVAPAASVRASRAARFAGALIDAALYAVGPLIPALILTLTSKPFTASRLFDDAGSLHEAFRHGLSETSTSKFLLVLPALVLLLAQWALVTLKGRTIGQSICGVAFADRDRSRSNGLKTAFGRSIVLFPIAAAIYKGVQAPWGGQLTFLMRPAAAVAGALILDGLFGLLPGASTLRDRLLRLRVILRGGEHRAFEPPKFSGVGFVVATLGLATTALLAGGVQVVLPWAASNERVKLVLPVVERLAVVSVPLAVLVLVGVSITRGMSRLRALRLFLIVLFIAAVIFGSTQLVGIESTDIDVPSVLSGGVLVLGLLSTGLLAAYWARRFLVGELALTALLVASVAFEAMLVGAIQVPALQRFMPPSTLDWVVYSLCIYFGAIVFFVLGSALGFMISSDEGLDLSTRFERLVARRHLRIQASHWLMLAFIATLAPILIYGVFIWPVLTVRRLMRGQAVARPLAPTVFMSLLTIVGVMFGVTSLTVVLAVMGGFERDLKEKILGTNAHGLLQRNMSSEDDMFTQWREIQDKVRATPGVAGVTPFVYGEVMITRDRYVTGAVLKGIDPETIGQVTDLQKHIREKGDGKLDFLAHPELIPQPYQRHYGVAPDPEDEANAKNGAVLPGIIIGREMATNLNVWVGDRLSVMNPLGDIGPNGPIPRSITFRVAAVFVSGMYEYDSKFVYIQLNEAQRFFRMHGAVTGLELRFFNVDDARPIMRHMVQALGGLPYRGKDWGEMNQNLFSALRLERVVMFVLLSFQVLIACICVIATLVMLVIEKRKEVATLKSMGAREGSIMKLFVLEGLMIGGIGTFYGSAAGYFFCKLIEKFGVGLNPEVYYIDKLPVVIDPVAFVSVALVAMVLVFIATIYPARRGGSIAPVEGFRDE